MYHSEQRRIHFPQAETSAEFFDLPSKKTDKSLPHPPQIRFSAQKCDNNSDSKIKENRRKTEQS